jgi:glycosyltransferase involved in cell wall biosynthesis
MEEAGGKHALYADPFQVEEFAAQISKLINDQSLSTGMLSGVEEHLAKFTSKKIASDLERVYNSVL